MIHDDSVSIDIAHIGTITWSPAEPWHRIVEQIKALLRAVEEDAEVEMSPNRHGEPVLYLSFQRGPLVEFPEGGVLTVGRDMTGALVCWASAERRRTPLGMMRATIAREEALDAELRKARRNHIIMAASIGSIATGVIYIGLTALALSGWL